MAKHMLNSKNIHIPIKNLPNKNYVKPQILFRLHRRAAVTPSRQRHRVTGRTSWPTRVRCTRLPVLPRSSSPPLRQHLFTQAFNICMRTKISHLLRLLPHTPTPSIKLPPCQGLPAASTLPATRAALALKTIGALRPIMLNVLLTLTTFARPVHTKLDLAFLALDRDHAGCGRNR